MPDPSIRMLELASQLIQRTESGNVTWTQHSKDPEFFQTVIGTNVVSIRSADSDGSHPFVLMLWSKKAEEEQEEGQPRHKVIEKVTTSMTLPGAPVGWEARLAQLWRAARTQALKINETLDAVMESLTE